MCLGDLGVVVGFAPDRSRRDAVVVDTVRGHVEASILMAPDARPGDHVVVHSGHVLQVIDAARAGEAALLRRGDDRVESATPSPASPNVTRHVAPDATGTAAPGRPS